MTLSPRRLPSDEPPGPPLPLDLGDADHSIDLMLEWFAAHGDTYRVFSPGRNSWTWVIHDPDDVKRVMVTNHRNYTKGVGMDRVRLLLGNGLITSEGEFWRRQRRMMQPAFHRKVIERFAGVIDELNAAMFDRWSAAAERSERVNLTQGMSELALDVVLHSIFSEDLGRLVTDLNESPFMMVTRDSKRDPRFAYEFRQLGTVVQQIIRQRRAHGKRHFDFTQMLMEFKDPDTQVGMTERELLDEILTLVVAGHETTASTLNWTWWLVSQHPEVERRLQDEQDRVGLLGAGATYADLERLPYTLAVLQEALRLYPPAWILTRRAIGPDKLGGYDVPPGTDVFLSPFVVHRHPAFWDNADRFNPGRFEPGRGEARHKFAYLPFGAGPRHCIGENFSIFEMMLHLNGAARRFRLRPTDTQPVTMEARINLRTTRDIQMMVEKR
jgi:enediyne biosynthesis protein E7